MSTLKDKCIRVQMYKERILFDRRLYNLGILSPSLKKSIYIRFFFQNSEKIFSSIYVKLSVIKISEILAMIKIQLFGFFFFKLLYKVENFKQGILKFLAHIYRNIVVKKKISTKFFLCNFILPFYTKCNPSLSL